MMREVTADDVREAFGSLEPCAPITEGSKRNYALVQFDDGSVGVFRHDDEAVLPAGVIAAVDIGPWYPTSVSEYEAERLARALRCQFGNREYHARVIVERITGPWRYRAPFYITAEWFDGFENEAREIARGETTIERVVERAMGTWLPDGAIIEENRVYDWVAAAVDDIGWDEEVRHGRP